MRVILPLLVALLAVPATSNARQAPVPNAQVDSFPGGRCQRGDAAYARGELVWCGGPRQALASQLVWSGRRDAVAFATRGPHGKVTLRVAMVQGEYRGTLLSWPLAIDDGSVAVMWLGESRVGIGRSSVRPKMVASWKLAKI